MLNNELFIELHEGHPEHPLTIHVAANDIRLIRPKIDEDMGLLRNVLNPEAYKTCVAFKGDSWMIFVHETPETVVGLCGFSVSR